MMISMIKLEFINNIVAQPIAGPSPCSSLASSTAFKLVATLAFLAVLLFIPSPLGAAFEQVSFAGDPLLGLKVSGSCQIG